MAAIILRLLLLAAGMTVTEIGLGSALVAGSAAGWVLTLLIGLPLILAGSAGFMVPLLGGQGRKETITMRRSVLSAIVLSLAASFHTVTAVFGHSGDGQAKIVVEPSDITAGGTVTLAGSGLEPDSDRVLVLAGQDLVVEFGTVRTDADGMLQQELLIPGHLPSGSYEVRAIGDETLTVPLAVTAAAGNEAPAPPAADQTVTSRQRSPIELGLLVAFVGLAALVGSLLVWRAERFRAVGRA